MKTHESKEQAERIMGWLDGDLAPEESEKLLKAFQDDPSLRQEAEALRELTQSLSTLGAFIRRHVPQVDLVETIMQQIYDLAGVERQVHLSTNAPGRIRRLRPFQAVRWALAAAVLIMLGLFLWQQQDFNTTAPTPLAMRNPAVETPAHSSETPETPFRNEDIQKITLSPPMLHENDTAATEDPPIPESSRDGMTFRAIADLQLAALNRDSQALLQLQQWASFSLRDVEDLLSSENLEENIQALISDSLPAGRAVAALREYSGADVENAYSNFLLARQLFSLMDPPPEVWKVLNDWETSDPANSLPQFMEASLYFYEGDAAAALAILDSTKDYAAASAYALSSAQYRQSAYIELGVEADSAALLAASRAGVEEYVFLTTMGSALMAQGEAYEQSGDTTTAGSIYNAVHRFGGQIVNGATFANEALAGYDLQMDALNAFERLPSTLDTNGTLAASLMEGLAELQPIFDALADIIATAVDDSVLLQVAEIQLTEGDLNLLELLPE